MQQQFYHKNFLHTRNTNMCLPVSYRLISSDWIGHHRNQVFIPSLLTVGSKVPSPARDVLLVPNLVLPYVIPNSHNHYCNTRGHFTSPRTYALQPQPQPKQQENQVKQPSLEIKDPSNNERTESFITGGNPQLADLWHEINSFDYERFVESIESNCNNNNNNNVDTNVKDHMQPSPQDHESIIKYENVSDELIIDCKPELNCTTKCLSSSSSKTEKSVITSSSDKSLKEDYVSTNDSSTRLTIVPSPSTSPRLSPPSSPHLCSTKFDEYLYNVPQKYEASFEAKYRYKCTVPNCSQRFKEYRLLISHLRIHHGHDGKNVFDQKKSGKAMVQCMKCRHFFVSKWYLKKHRYLCKEVVRQGEWHDCEYCAKSYLTDCERKKHYAKDHSDKIKELWEQQWY
ncbi:hypothetical protein C1645_784018 [Glomus cerebriforme]|uniref:C2H2-type domain-containing protein n=1 Tax=Glomus cerebriforme TaxID=658196 RepID=A0A397SG00_9GLOM|nr:hypothetical protein C1645_784018 [Glomus cerebriforme]